MLATFVIGLREGLEAALIVGIIAAFLRNNGRSLAAMWLGVALAVILSIAVGLSLKLAQQALPYAAQEGLEAIIGIVAVIFVTGMILWMNAHARDMKRQIEAEAAHALGQASARALALMAFLAVLREGFETSVFLLATFEVAQSATLAAIGAVVGLLVSIIIGWGIYIGGVRFNLSRFFRITGAFLILVAAGLVLSSLRTAHEAGWILGGQQRTVDLAWLVAPGSVQSALITGVLGIPADPRLIEVIGWLAYLVPVMLFIYWPASWRPGLRMSARLRLAAAGLFAVAALGFAVLHPTPRPESPAEASIVPVAGAEQAAGTPIGSARLLANGKNAPSLAISLDGQEALTVPLPAAEARPERHQGLDTTVWRLSAETEAPAVLPGTLTLLEIVELSGGRIPTGIDRQRNPGPFAADWSRHREITVRAADGVLLDATMNGTMLVTLSGGGLQTPRTLRPRTLAPLISGDRPAIAGWQLADTYREKAIAALHRLGAARVERHLWAVQLPIALALIALLLAISAGRLIMRPHDQAGITTAAATRGTGSQAHDPIKKGAQNAAN